jgi:hypothetical protein
MQGPVEHCISSDTTPHYASLPLRPPSPCGVHEGHRLVWTVTVPASSPGASRAPLNLTTHLSSLVYASCLE